jgi:NAD(P)-dependent dehydrogenase (short-subunit alcohol dehydrogenase family)
MIERNVRAVQGDVTELDDLDRLFRIVAEEKGQLGLLVANSGMIEQVKLEDWVGQKRLSTPRYCSPPRRAASSRAPTLASMVAGTRSERTLGGGSDRHFRF